MKDLMPLQLKDIDIDRTYADDAEEPVVYVTLPSGYQIKFWMTDLTDEEYLWRAQRIRELDR